MSSAPSSSGKRDVSRTLGETLATMSHLADLAIDWGFKKMKNVGEAPVTCGKASYPLCYVKRVTQPVLRFIGSMGDAYYEWYEKMKARRAGKE